MSLLNAENLAAQGFPVAISELMGDPLPSIGLPSEEYIELTNVSDKPINISGWMISNHRTQSRLPDGLVIAPGEYLLLCPGRAIDLFQEFGRCIGLRPFPVISNAGDTILLYDNAAKLMHAVAYTPALFTTDQATGGWSLELVNTAYACQQTGNWAPSSNSRGGSPGMPNAQDTEWFEAVQPEAINAWGSTDSTVRILFSAAVNQAAAERPGNYRFKEDLKAIKARIVAPFGREVELLLNKGMKKEQIYSLTVTGMGACAEQQATTGIEYTLSVGLADAGEKTVRINEILFDPAPGGKTYVELLHAGNGPVNLARLQVGSRGSNGRLSRLRSLVPSTRFLYPGEYLVVSESVGWVKQQFHVKFPARLVESKALPPLSITSGQLVLVEEDSSLLDELHYSADWHHPQLRNKKNIALERKEITQETQQPDNWSSAAMHAGYGTPGYQNSQSGELAGADNFFLETEGFSPDGDGIQDICTIFYRFRQAGNLTSIRIYDRRGILKRVLVNNVISAAAGKFYWDGTDTHGHKLPSGLYLLIADTWHRSGKTKRYRMAVTLGRKY